MNQEFHEEPRASVVQTNANGDITNLVLVTVHKEIVDILNWEKENVMTFTETIKNPISRKRLLTGMSPGPFSCVAGNIIASHYLGPELDTAGITNYNQQLIVVSVLAMFDAKSSARRMFCSTSGALDVPLLAHI